jgi:hypothetical protein
MKTRWVVLGLALCLVAAPAKADLFGFTISNPMTTFNGTNLFQSGDFSGTTADLYRNIPAPTVTAGFDAGAWAGSASFLMSMTISNLTATTADGAGTFQFIDVDGDSISGNVSGTWSKLGSAGAFFGTLGNVTFTSQVNNTFDGDSGDAVSMIFNSPQPWSGGITEITSSGTWFTLQSAYRTNGGSIDATVVPVPAAVLLGILGMSVAGLRLRKFA